MRILRVGAGMSQGELAHEAGLRRPSVCLIENGRQTPRRQTALKIAAALGQPVELVFPHEKGVSRPT